MKETDLKKVLALQTRIDKCGVRINDEILKYNSMVNELRELSRELQANTMYMVDDIPHRRDTHYVGLDLANVTSVWALGLKPLHRPVKEKPSASSDDE